MPPQAVIVESQNATSVADGATIEWRIRISQPDEGRGRCKGSRAWDPRKDFSQPTQPDCQMKRPVITPSNGAAPCSKLVSCTNRFTAAFCATILARATARAAVREAKVSRS